MMNLELILIPTVMTFMKNSSKILLVLQLSMLHSLLNSILNQMNFKLESFHSSFSKVSIHMILNWWNRQGCASFKGPNLPRGASPHLR